MSKRHSLLLWLVLIFAGCARTEWIERREPTTEAERKAVAEQAEKILAATPRVLSGRDQDWDDAIAEAYRQARQTSVRLTYWEWEGNGFPEGGGTFTGRWRYANNTEEASNNAPRK
jgi:hypothetical protein